MPATGAPILPCYNDLNGSLEHAWQVLAEAVTNRHSGFRTLNLATVAADGSPTVRTVVLRACDRTQNQLRFNTDRRSPKISQIIAEPRAMLHGYDADQKLQLRMRCHLHLATDQQCEAAWEQTARMSRECYQVTSAPSTPTPSLETIEFDAATTQEGFIHFKPVFAQIDYIEWLYLAAKGHRRARFTLSSAPTKMEWLVP